MPPSEAIVNPFRGGNAPDIGPVVFLVSNGEDLRSIAAHAGVDETAGIDLYMSRLYMDRNSGASFAAAGPFVGAPYAVMLLETLIAWGAKKIVFFGWCGAISTQVKTGDIIVPTGAYSDEGTSRHYHPEGDGAVLPSTEVSEQVAAAFQRREHTILTGDIWTTDAIYRETREKVVHFQERNVLAVEMELSAIYTVGNFRNVAVGAVLVVSDELSSLTWRPGFGEKRFKASRRIICDTIGDLCRTPSGMTK